MQRLATLCQKNGFVYTDTTEIKLPAEYAKLMDEFRFKDAFDFAWGKVQEINKKIQRFFVINNIQFFKIINNW